MINFMEKEFFKLIKECTWGSSGMVCRRGKGSLLMLMETNTKDHGFEVESMDMVNLHTRWVIGMLVNTLRMRGRVRGDITGQSIITCSRGSS